jgi:hypothetical protein
MMVKLVCFCDFFVCDPGAGWFSRKKRFTVSGYVKDVSNGEALIGAPVFTPGKSAGTGNKRLRILLP